MDGLLLVTFEILVIVVAPLLILYLKSHWPLRSTIPSLVSIPVLWYLVYSPLHELSHVVGAYLAGGRVTAVKLMPRFWMGEFSGGAQITPAGLIHGWQWLLMTSSPYLLDVLCVIAAYFILRKNLLKSPFTVGLTFMLLCLRPAFDLVCETVAFLGGARGDLYHIEKAIGGLAIWTLLGLSIAVSLTMIVIVLRSFSGAAGTSGSSEG